MTTANYSGRWCRLSAVCLCFMLVSGCEALNTVGAPSAPVIYSLDYARRAAPAAPHALPMAAPTLLVSPPRAAASLNSPHIIYVREPHKLEYFALSEWIDTPARMLAPLIVAAVENSGAFHAVVHVPSSAGGELRLDTEILHLQQEFDVKPSRVRFVLRANLIEDTTRRVIATRRFEAVATAHSEDTYGGVLAANQAVQTVLEELAIFCAEAAESRRLERSSESSEAKASRPQNP